MFSSDQSEAMHGGNELYDRIGIGYDATRRADPYLVSRLHHHLHLHPGGSYLDLACGTGNYTIAVAQTGGDWSGVDCSMRMIAAAEKKSPSLTWHVADVTALPPGDSSVDGVMCILAVHHFADIPAAFAEVGRVLKPGGRFVLFTSDPEQMLGYWLNAYFPEAMNRSMEALPEIRVLEQAMRAAGIEPVLHEVYSVQPDLQDFFLYSGRYDPARYLDPAVRAGISTFSLLADAEETERGCMQLADDIASKRIDEVIAGYPGERGDYLFIVGESV